MRALTIFNKRAGKSNEPPGPRTEGRDGSALVDCRGCPGPQDLNDPACMRCGLRSLSTSPSAERIVLSRHQDVSYEGACMGPLRGMAEAVLMCRSAVAGEDRGCASCPARPSLVLGNLADSIPYGWSGTVAEARSPQGRARCHACTAHTNQVASAVFARLRAVEREVSRGAFMVVGESGHA